MVIHEIINKEDKNLNFAKIKIDEARKAFRNKNFKTSLDIYNSIEQKHLFNWLDRDIIVYCERNCIKG